MGTRSGHLVSGLPPGTTPQGQGDLCLLRQTERLVTSAASCFLPSFQKRRLDKARQKKEARAADRLEQELLQGISSQMTMSTAVSTGLGLGLLLPSALLVGLCSPGGSQPESRPVNEPCSVSCL